VAVAYLKILLQYSQTENEEDHEHPRRRLGSKCAHAE